MAESIQDDKSLLNALADTTNSSKSAKTNSPQSLLGQRIRSERKARGLSQRRLAKLAGVSFTTIQRIETDNRRTTANNLAAVLSVLRYTNIDDILAEFDDDYASQVKAVLNQRNSEKEHNDALRDLEEIETYRPYLNRLLDEIKVPEHFHTIYDVVQTFVENERLKRGR